MAYRKPQLSLLVSRVAVALGVVLFAAGSVLVFIMPRDNVIDKAYDKPTQNPVYSAEPEPDPLITHILISKKVLPSTKRPAPVPKKTSAPTKSASVAGPGQPLNSTTAPDVTPRSNPSPKPKPPLPSSSPTLSPTSSPTPTGTVWTTSVVAVQAAQRMEAAATVGDPACSLASYGDPDPSLVPSDIKSVGVGESGSYWCLIYTR